MVQTVNEDTFKEKVLDAEKPVLVDFGASWCPPCRAMEPVIDRLGDRTEFDVVKVDVDKDQNISGAFGVLGIPMLILFNEGDQVMRLQGLQSERNILKAVEEALVDQ